MSSELQSQLKMDDFMLLLMMDSMPLKRPGQLMNMVERRPSFRSTCGLRVYLLLETCTRGQGLRPNRRTEVAVYSRVGQRTAGTRSHGAVLGHVRDVVCHCPQRLATAGWERPGGLGLTVAGRRRRDGEG